MGAIIFSKLLLAHLLGDFVLRSKRRLKEKGKPLWRSRRLILHAAIHSAVTLLVLWDIALWPYALLIGLSHYLGDWLKETFHHDHSGLWFAGDQIFHLLLLVVVGLQVYQPDWSAIQWGVDLPWIALTGFVMVTFPASAIIHAFLSRWPPSKSAEKVKGLSSAGQWIGILERILIFTFLMVGQWQGIGFLIAAKSVLRFSDLKNNKEIHLTEYILIGTLLSFSIAIFTGLATVYFSR